jgi:hypothetical protein
VVLTTNALGNVPLTNIWVRFIPTNAAFYSEFITNSSPGAATQTVQVTGLGLAADAPLLTVTPISLAFGNVITNKTPADQMFTVTGVNLTNAVTVTAPPACFWLSTNGTDFSQSAVTLATNGSGGIDITNIYVRFTPTSEQAYGGSITNSTAGAVEVKTVALAGTGVVQTLYLGTETLAFGNVVTNTTSANQSFTLSGSNLQDNVTVTAPSAIFAVSTNSSTGFGQSCTVSVANVSSPSGGSLPSTMVYARFTPSALGPYLDNITCSSAGAVSTNKAVSGTGVVPPGPNAYVVPPGTLGASPAFPYNTWALAFTNIQDAVTFAGANQPLVTTVVVSNGTYAITAQITIATNITVCSFGNGVTGGLANAALTTINAGSVDGRRVMYVNHAGAVIDGLTMTRGQKINGAGAYLNAGTVQNCRITGNDLGMWGSRGVGSLYIAAGGLASNCHVVANYGGNQFNGIGIYISGGTVRRSNISNNSAGDEKFAQGGIGVYSDNAASVIDSCVITNNRVLSFGETGYNGGAGVLLYGGGTVRNSLIAGNVSKKDGGGVAGNGTASIVENCTIVYNSSSNNAGGVYNATVTNSIVYFNTSGGSDQNWNGASMAYSCTTPTNGLTGAGNTQANPLLGSSYTLQTGSPCIDKGANRTWMDGAKDLAGNTRKTYGGVAGSRGSPVVDMGAYEAPEVPPKGTVFMIR